jgi:carboxylate-amine ligase
MWGCAAPTARWRCATGCGRCCRSCSRSPPIHPASTPRTPGSRRPDAFGDWASWAEYVEFLKRTNSIVEHTQLWWSVRPHHSYGTVELRICDAQTTAEDSTALAGLIAACIAQAAIDHDDGVRVENPPARLLEENLWRAIRYGLDGRMIDLARGVEIPARAAVEGLWSWTEPAREAARIEVAPEGPTGAQRQRAALLDGGSLREVYADVVRETMTTYAQEVPA